MFFNWLFGPDYKFKHQMLVCAAAICWALWISWNDIVFYYNCHTKPYMQVLYTDALGATTKVCGEDSDLMNNACRPFEITVMEIFVNHRWRFTKRIAV